jgi:hypothetical protein
MLIDSDNIEEFYDPPNYDLEEGPGKAPRVAFYAALAQETGGIWPVAAGWRQSHWPSWAWMSRGSISRP